jgi:hypothetical protein
MKRFDIWESNTVTRTVGIPVRLTRVRPQLVSRTEGTPVRVIRVLLQPVGFSQVEHAFTKIDVFFQGLAMFQKKKCLLILKIQIIYTWRLRLELVSARYDTAKKKIYSRHFFFKV